MDTPQWKILALERVHGNPNKLCIAKKQFASHHVASTKAIWFGPGSSITILSTAILFTIGSSNPVSSTNKFKLRFAHGWWSIC